MHYLITGGRGFIGSHLCQKIIERGDQVTILTSQGKLPSHNKNLQYVYGDVTNIDSLHNVFTNNNIDGVFHLAALGNANLSTKCAREFNNVNINGTLNLLTVARENNVNDIVFSSSALVYGKVQQEIVTEKCMLNPLTPYAVSKIAGEYYCKMFTELYGMNISVLRYFNVYGPGQDATSEFAAAIPKFIHLILHKKSPIIYGDGTQERDFVYVKDVVAANLLAMDKTQPGIYNIGTGKSHSLNNIVTEIMNLSGINLDTVYMDSRGSEMKKVVADINRAHDILGYMPKYDIKSGIKEILEYKKRE